MWNYSQPDFYHFSEDSIAIARKAASLARSDSTNTLSILDLGCGCGVIGIEISKLVELAVELTGCDIQDDYREHFEMNTREIPGQVNFVSCSFKNLVEKIPSKKFDMVVSNPPYFLADKGRSSPDEKRNACRQFVYDSPAILLKTMEYFKQTDGIAVLVFRTGDSFLQAIQDEYPDYRDKWTIEESNELSFLMM